jgi:hypothetical protein
MWDSAASWSRNPSLENFNIQIPMKTRFEILLAFHLAFALGLAPHLRAEEPSPEIAGLQKAAADFVIAYN